MVTQLNALFCMNLENNNNSISIIGIELQYSKLVIPMASIKLLDS